MHAITAYMQVCSQDMSTQRARSKGGWTDMPGYPPDRIPAAWAPAYALGGAQWLLAPVLLEAPCI